MVGLFDRLRGKKDPQAEAKKQAEKEEKAKKEAEEKAAKKAEKEKKKELKKQAKEDKKAQKEEFDAIDAKVDEIRQKAKSSEKEGDFPHSKIYKLVNLGIKIALKGKDEGGKVKGFKVFKSIVGNAGTIISAGKLGLEIKEELEAELGIKLKDVVKNPDDVNKVLQSDFVKGIMADFWLWEVVRLQAPRINGIIPRFKKEITEGLHGVIFEPSALSDKTKMDLLEVILGQENTLSAFTDILAASKGEIAKMLSDPETKLSTSLKELGVDTKDVAQFIPHAEPLLKIASEKQKELAKVFGVLKPVLLNEKGLEAAELIKVGAEIKSLADAFLPEVGKILAERKTEVSNLLKAKPVQDALKAQGLEVKAVAQVVDVALPVLSKILSKKEITNRFTSLATLPTASRNKAVMELVEVVLSQENIVGEVAGVVIASKGAITKMLNSDKTAVSQAINNLGVDEKDIASFIPHAEPLLKIASEKQKELAKVFGVLKPVILGEKAFEAADLLKVGSEIKTLIDAFLPEVGKVMAERKDEIQNLLNAKPVQDALKAQNIEVKDVQVVLDSVLPAVGKILSSDLVSGLTQGAQDFISKNSAIINKMRNAVEDAEKGIFKPENDLNNEEIKSLASGVFDLLIAAKPEKLLSEEVITPELVNGLVGVIPQKALDGIGISKDLVKKAVPHIRSVAALMLDSRSVEGYKKAVIENLDTLLDNKKSNKEKTKAGFKIIDAFFEKLASKEMAELFSQKGGIKDFLKENKAELGAALDKVMHGDREISKLKISGERVINAMLDEKTLTEIGKIYQDLKKNAMFGVVGKSIKLMYNNRDFRVLVFDIIISSIIVFIRDNLYPNYFKRAMVGASVHNVVEAICTKAALEKDKVNFKEEAVLFVEGLNALGRYTVTYGAYSALRLDNLDFKNMVVDDCDFRRTTFGANEKPLVMKDCSFSACDFTGAKFKGDRIDLSGSTFDLESFITMLPQLEKAHKQGIKIDIEGVKLYLPALPTKANQEKIDSIKKGEFGKMVYEQCVGKAQAKDQSRGG